MSDEVREEAEVGSEVALDEEDEVDEEEDVLGYATDAGVRMRERKSSAERMSKAERRRAGFRRITAYGVAEGVRIKLLSSFLRREHNVLPRVYDNALYAVRSLSLPHSTSYVILMVYG